MTALRLDGKALAEQIEHDLTQRVAAIRSRRGHIPVLATILVGDDPSSAIYVRMKRNACQRVGMESRPVVLPKETTTQQLLDEIDRLNADADVRGILLQHPVPSQIDERRCFDQIAIEKDVDGVTSHGFGLMALGERAFGSATPAGIMRLLNHYQIDVTGKSAVVVGRSPILGKPMALMLSNANATVTLCHSKTEGLPEIVHRADIVVGAVGKPEFIRADWIRDDSIVIDAGYHAGGIGDVDLRGAISRVFAYTPVPGGVGPMTIAALISHTVEATEASGCTTRARPGIS